MFLVNFVKSGFILKLSDSLKQLVSYAILLALSYFTSFLLSTQLSKNKNWNALLNTKVENEAKFCVAIDIAIEKIKDI